MNRSQKRYIYVGKGNTHSLSLWRDAETQDLRSRRSIARSPDRPAVARRAIRLDMYALRLRYARRYCVLSTVHSPLSPGGLRWGKGHRAIALRILYGRGYVTPELLQ